jgi:hypothetical protein
MHPLQVSVAKTVLAEYEGSVLVHGYSFWNAVQLPTDPTTRDRVIGIIQRIRGQVDIDLRKPAEMAFKSFTAKTIDFTIQDSDISWSWWQGAIDALRRGERNMCGHFILHNIYLGAVIGRHPDPALA